MATVRDLETDALRELGVLAESEVMTAAQAEDARRALNRLIDQWKAERLQIYRVVRSFAAITSGLGDYSLGLGQVAAPGVVNIDRPVFLDHVGIQNNSTPSTETLLQPLTDDGWAQVAEKTLTSDQPSHWYYRPDFPYGRLKLWPIPTSTSLTLEVYVPSAVQEFPTINDTVLLPPGFQRLIVKGLAVELAPSYGVQPDNNLLRQAIDAKAVVKSVNQALSDLSFPREAAGFGRGGYW